MTARRINTGIVTAVTRPHGWIRSAIAASWRPPVRPVNRTPVSDAERLAVAEAGRRTLERLEESLEGAATRGRAAAPNAPSIWQNWRLAGQRLEGAEASRWTRVNALLGDGFSAMLLSDADRVFVRACMCSGGLHLRPIDRRR